MNKLDLIQALKDSNNLSRSEAETIIDLFFDKIAEAMAQGDRGETRVFVPLALKNIRDTQNETPGLLIRLRSNRKSCLFLRWAGN
jgi:integration host factor subunit beta